MRYSELLERLKPEGLEQIGRMTITGKPDSVIMIGRREEAIVPFQFTFHSLYAPAGEDDFDLDEEEILALLRRFKIPREKILP